MNNDFFEKLGRDLDKFRKENPIKTVTGTIIYKNIKYLDFFGIYSYELIVKINGKEKYINFDEMSDDFNIKKDIYLRYATGDKIKIDTMKSYMNRTKNEYHLNLEQ